MVKPVCDETHRKSLQKSLATSRLNTIALNFPIPLRLGGKANKKDKQKPRADEASAQQQQSSQRTFHEEEQVINGETRKVVVWDATKISSGRESEAAELATDPEEPAFIFNREAIVQVWHPHSTGNSQGKERERGVLLGIFLV
jgi:hypothetical protein